jgi:predicted aspartyl protease
VFPADFLSLATLGLSLAILGLCLATLGLWPAPAWAQMYRWTDEQGGIHYSQGIYSVPERFRSKAQLLAYPERPAAPAESPSPAGGVASGVTRISFTPGKAIMVSAKINGEGSAQLMLDTGASVTVINPRVLAGMGIGSREAVRGSVKGATGTADVLFVPVESIEVGGARSGPLRVAAHDVDLGQGDGLLGRDFLDQFKVNIDNTAGVVTISPK